MDTVSTSAFNTTVCTVTMKTAESTGKMSMRRQHVMQNNFTSRTQQVANSTRNAAADYSAKNLMLLFLYSSSKAFHSSEHQKPSKFRTHIRKFANEVSRRYKKIKC